MKEQQKEVKELVFDFKDIGWSVQKLEKELQFSNGTLGKAISGKAGLSVFRLSRLIEFHKLTFHKPTTETKSVDTQLPKKEEILTETTVVEISEQKEESVVEKMLRENREKFSKQYKK